jgi:hypothetical protein
MRLFRPPPGPVRCLQCGRPGADVIAARLRKVRCSCEHCGAVITSPRSELRAPAAAAVDDPLTAVMTPSMARWLRSRYPREELVLPVDRVTIELWYAEFDQFVMAARESATVRSSYDEICAEPPEPVLDFPRVVTALMAACFDVEVALRRLGEDEPVRERMEHARHWIATGGVEGTWLGDGKVLLEPDRELAARLLEPGALTGRFDRPRSVALSRALFGIERAPQVRLLVEQFSEEPLQDWIGAYLTDGSRPLRERILASLRDRR